MKITLSNGAELHPLIVTGGPQYIQGENRDTLTFVFPETESMEALDAAFTAENCENITIANEGEAGAIHHGYVIRASLSKVPVEVSPASDENPAVYENRIKVEMSQRTYYEKQVDTLIAQGSAAVYDEMGAAYQEGVEQA